MTLPSFTHVPRRSRISRGLAVFAVIALGCSGTSGSPDNGFGAPEGANESDGGSSSSGAGPNSGGSSGSSSGSSSSGGSTSTSGSTDAGATTSDSGGTGTKADATTDAPSGFGDGSAGTILAGDGGACPAPPGIDANTASALQAVNTARAAMGSPCATMVAALNTSASKHCAYVAANASNMTCIADVHTEVSGCMDFVAAQFSGREQMAGYAGQPSFEVMAEADNGAAAVQEWIDSVWHRTPVLSPWVRDLGYGAATRCDTIDFGVGAASPSNLILTYPYDGQTGVPTSFNGMYEGPMPPAPPSGWPSGYPVHVYVKGASLTTHELTDDSGTMLNHEWITQQTNSLAQNTAILYGDAPLGSGKKYHVHVAGTRTSGGAAIDVNISFTTK